MQRALSLRLSDALYRQIGIGLLVAVNLLALAASCKLPLAYPL